MMAMQGAQGSGAAEGGGGVAERAQPLVQVAPPEQHTVSDPSSACACTFHPHMFTYCIHMMPFIYSPTLLADALCLTPSCAI